MELHEILERVNDRASFLAFVAALLADRKNSIAQEKADPSSPYEPDANDWENTSLVSFLDAALAWAENNLRFPEEPSWQAFATFLYCGKVYE